MSFFEDNSTSSKKYIFFPFLNLSFRISFLLFQSFSENSLLFNRVIDNYPHLAIRMILKHNRRKITSINYNDNRELMIEVKNNTEIMETIKSNIYIDKSLEKLEKLNELEFNSPEYNTLYDEIVSVGEYHNDDLNKC